ncbi:iron complex transport system ATP-binding protein [Evansella caseinilytica]|uniref:Iron complex transport system ATP-binding protein n=1 Tax=Evansella caseinilytica TaxID=1503961 RepID=A0A1H3RDX3_9BACI|nr:ABC transporter ATP-binding protein [Evansella caseinilytica]SDZ23753.1 iron complex transport system ATP-binding protein [Evansella caseinilytica]
MEVNGVTFSYDKKNNQLKSVTTMIAKGKITTIIGPNGSGKSTLLGVLCKNYTAGSGNVVLDGKEISRYKPKEFARKLAVVHQQNEAPADMTVERIVGFGRLAYRSLFGQNSEKDSKAIEWALSCTNLSEKRQWTLSRLSGGERQRVWIAMSLAQSTPLLFLDEPTTYLDIYYQFEILELIKRLNKEFGLTIVMVLHDINQAIRYSDHIAVMKGGELLMEGTPEQVITEEMMKEIYGIEVVLQENKEAGLHVIPVGTGR